MSFEFEAPESTDTGGAFLQEPGTYHFAVLATDENPQSKKGELLNGFRVDAEVLAGQHKGKQIELMFFNPKPTDKNNGEMAKKKQWRFGMAVGLVGGPAAVGEKKTVELAHSVGRQFIATVAHDNRETDAAKKFLQLNFADIWHIDDPAAPQCERNQEAIAVLTKLAPQLRRKPESFGKPSGNGAPAASRPATQQQPATAAAMSADDLLS
jgi:hypothetical protein